MRKPMEVTLLKPRITGEWTRSGKNIKWRCRIYQRIGEMQVIVAASRGRYRYSPKSAYRSALRAAEDTSFATAVSRLIGA
jgi:hypothetical protein